jgi:hypothetical protein
MKKLVTFITLMVFTIANCTANAYEIIVFGSNNTPAGVPGVS